jgi:hypothetical protein
MSTSTLLIINVATAAFLAGGCSRKSPAEKLIAKLNSSCDPTLVMTNALQFFQTNETVGFLSPRNYPAFVNMVAFAVARKPPTYVTVGTNLIQIELEGSFGNEGVLIYANDASAPNMLSTRTEYLWWTNSIYVYRGP